MKQVYKYDENFIFVEPVLVYEKDDAGNYVIPDSCTEVEPPDSPSLFKRKFDPILREWTEGATQAEINEFLSHAKSSEGQSPIEMLKAQNAVIMMQLQNRKIRLKLRRK